MPFALAILLTSCGDEVPESARPPDVPPPPSQFARFVPPEESDLPRLETSVTSYLGPGGQTVDLIAALHIADPDHYRELQELFRGYDALLYEMVAEEGARPTPGERSPGALSGFQRLLTNAFDLTFQLDAIDYTPENFVHADLDPESMATLMEERGESIFTLLFQAMLSEFTRAREADGEARPVQPLDLITAFQNRRGRHSLRMLFAQQMRDIESVAAGFGGPDGESVLVEGRNRRALQVFDRQLARGKRRLGIYYGAAHMPDLEERLLAKGFTKTAERWLTAWDLRVREDRVPPRYRKDKD